MSDLYREKQEAIEAGERALMSLKTAKKNLDSARGWGVIDILGGGGLSGLIKHLKINEASRNVEQARRDLISFSKELRDVSNLTGITFGIGDFATFADFFLDGMLADFYVQGKINMARDQVDEAIRRVETVLSTLRR